MGFIGSTGYVGFIVLKGHIGLRVHNLLEENSSCAANFMPKDQSQDVTSYQTLHFTPSRLTVPRQNYDGTYIGIASGGTVFGVSGSVIMRIAEVY